jgi:hypothetical protein
VFNSAERPMASIQNVVGLGDTGGGDLGSRVLKIFATGNHRRVPDPSGKFDEATPPDMMSFNFPGSQAHIRAIAAS